MRMASHPRRSPAVSTAVFHLFAAAASLSFDQRLVWRCDAFAFPRFPLHPPSNNSLGGAGGGNGGGDDSRRRRRNTHWFGDGDGNDGGNVMYGLAGLSWMVDDDACSYDGPVNIDWEENSIERKTFESIRGGSATAVEEEEKSKSSSFTRTIFVPFRMICDKLPSNPFRKSARGDQLKKQEELLSSTQVESVSAPGSDILPPDIVTKCANEAKLIGGTLTPETLEATANMLNRLYLERGYVMNSVTGATLVPSKDDDGRGHVELKVREVKLAMPRGRKTSPVRIRFVEKVDRDESTDDSSIISLPSQSSDSGYEAFREIQGRTRPSKLARMTKLAPGSHFRIIPERWSKLAESPGGGMLGGSQMKQLRGKSAIFSTIHAVQPMPTSKEDTVELEIVASENKPYVSVEYGLTKSLFSNQWEGELDLKHLNAFGGGEVASVNVRKGRGSAKKGALNWNMSIRDDTGDTGYDMEIFRDHVGVTGLADGKQSPEEGSSLEPNGQHQFETNNECAPIRTGASMRLVLPGTRTKLHAFTVPSPRAITAKFERLGQSIKSERQSMASISTDLGSYAQSFKVASRTLQSTLAATVAAGGKWDADSGDDSNAHLYGTGAVTSQQVMRLGNGDGSSPPADLAIRNTISASTKHLPQHEAILLGMSSRIRGYRYNYQNPHKEWRSSKSNEDEQNILQSAKQFLRGNFGEHFRPPVALSKSLSGSVEVRIPVQRLAGGINQQSLPEALRTGTVLIFGDYCFAQAQPSPSLSEDVEDLSSFNEKLRRHSCLGFGLRNNIQGLPLKVDACINEHGTKGLFFGIGM